MTDKLIPGVEVAMAGRNWVVPPLTLGQLRRLAPELAEIGSGASRFDGAAIAAIVKLVAAALGRNYPDLDEATVEEMLDLGNAAGVLDAVLAGSGLKRASPGEAEAPPAAGAGTASTASSPPRSAGGRKTSTS